MLKKILIPMFVALLCWLSLTSYAGLTANAPRPEQVVAEFQKLPHYEMFCKDERWRGVVPAKLTEKYNNFFSKEFYKIFLWSECVDPKYPPHYGGLYKALYFDIRFSIPYQDLYLRKTVNFAEGIQINAIPNTRPDLTIVRVDFNYDGTKMFTRYTLIQEDGLWKIDDIAPQATFVNGRQPADNYGYEIADYNFSSDSIKTDMQKNYDAAMKRYTQEQGAKPKP